MGARAWVPVERNHMFGGRFGRAPARVAVCTGARLPVGRGGCPRDVRIRSDWWVPGAPEVGARAWVPWDASTCSHAEHGGYLEVLKWARAHDCPWDEETCSYAAGGGHLEVLQWAREHHCPWNEDTCEYAAENEELEVLRWAIEHGCPGGEQYAHHLI